MQSAAVQPSGRGLSVGNFVALATGYDASLSQQSACFGCLFRPDF